MWAKYIMLLIVCVGVVVSSAGEYDDVKPSTLYQIPCMSFGGLCLNDGECPAGKQRNGLCPLGEGRECCTVRKSTLCRSAGGECVDFKCPSTLQFKATDCKEGKHCCVMVH